MTAQHFRTHLVPGVLAHVRRLGVVSDTLLADAGLPRDAGTQPWVEIRLTALHHFLTLAAERSGDDALGVNVGKSLTRATWDLIHLSALSSPTLHEALVRVGRLMPLFNDVVEITVARTDDALTYVHRIEGEPECLSEHGNEAMLVSLLERLRQGTGEEVRPEACWVAHRHGDRTPLAAALGVARIASGAGENGLRFARRVGDLPLRSADPVLLDVLDRLSREQLALLPTPRGASAQVCRALHARKLEAGIPPLSTIAKQLGASTRSLQRSLETEGTSYRALVDHVRRVRARALLASGTTATDVAYRLGYADRSTFLRAYARWTGNRLAREE